METHLPIDPEEADAVHRRFLPMSNHEDAGGGDGDKPEEELVKEEKKFLPLKTELPDYGATGGTNGVVAKGGAVDSPSTSKIPLLKEEEFAFDFKFLKRFYRLHGVLFLSIFSMTSGLFLFLLFLVLLQEYIVYQVGLIPSGYYKTLGDKDLPGFWSQTMKSLLLILAVCFVKSTTQYVQKVLTVTFRKVLCEAAHRIYFADIRYYLLNVLDKTIDNPDQRMTQDIDKFCSTYCDVLPKLIVSPFTIGYYCYQGYQRSGWEGPVGCFGFFLVATSINKLLMNPIVNYVTKQEKCEGDFRFVHMLVRVHSETIAFQQASLVEHRKVNDVFDKLADTQHSLYIRQYGLDFFVNFFSYIGSIFSYMILAIPIFSGRYNYLTPADLGFLISQNAFILMYLIFTFTSLVELSGKIADVAGVTHRISQLFEKLNALEDYWKDIFPSGHGGNPDPCHFDDWLERRQSIRERLTIKSPMEDYIQVDKECSDSLEHPRKLIVWSLENLTFCPPDSEEPLISNLSLEFVVGESILISGTSSAGKTSLLRVLRGLWPHSDGNLKNHFPPGPHGVYFCPQKSYLTWGTLREQISFPLHPDQTHMDDKLMLYYLDRLKLMPVMTRVGGFDISCSWSVYDSLSPGEIQRLCILRVFYHQPVVAILDEVTSALPIDMEEFVYSELKRLGITLISVGHRESIRKYHDKQLIIDSNGRWGIYPIVHG